MAKGKVHMVGAVADLGHGAMGDVTALCRQRHRKLLPLLLSDQWPAVTCARCLTHAPKPAPLPWWRRVVVWIRGRA